MRTIEQSPHYAEKDKPHPIIGRVAIAAMLFAFVTIIWAKVEILGTRDIERTLTDEDATLAQFCVDKLRALAFNRWATGFSQ